MIWPVAKVIISNEYSKGHPAYDLAGPELTPIIAPEKGIVTEVNENAKAYFGGKYVVLQGASGLRHYLGHMAQTRVSVGQSVSEGQHIGDMGHTGFAVIQGGVVIRAAPTGPHTHFESSRNGKTVDIKPLIGKGETDMPRVQIPPEIVAQHYANYSEGELKVSPSDPAAQNRFEDPGDDEFWHGLAPALHDLIKSKNARIEQLEEQLKNASTGEYVPVTQLFIKKG